MTSKVVYNYGNFVDLFRGWDQTRSISEFSDAVKNMCDGSARWMQPAFSKSSREKDYDIATFLLENFGEDINIFGEEGYSHSEFIETLSTLPITKARIDIDEEEGNVESTLSSLKKIRASSLDINMRFIHSSPETKIRVISDIVNSVLETSTETLVEVFDCSPDEEVEVRKVEVDKLLTLIGKCPNLRDVCLGLPWYSMDEDNIISILTNITITPNLESLRIGCKGYSPRILDTLQAFIRNSGMHYRDKLACEEFTHEQIREICGEDFDFGLEEYNSILNKKERAKKVLREEYDISALMTIRMNIVSAEEGLRWISATMGLDIHHLLDGGGYRSEIFRFTSEEFMDA